MKIACVMWNSYARLLKKAAYDTGNELRMFSNRHLEQNPAHIRDFLSACHNADILLLYRTSDAFWNEIDPEIRKIGKEKPVVCVGHDPTLWGLSTVPGSVVSATYAYLTYNGEANMHNLLRYLEREILGHNIESISPPQEIPWQGLWHPDAPHLYQSIAEYLEWYSGQFRRSPDSPWVGILFPRMAWVSGNCEIETALINALETEGLNVIASFTYSIKDETLGTRGMAEIVEDYFTKEGRSRVGAIIKLTPFMLGSARGHSYGNSPAKAGIELLSSLNIPVFQPVISSRLTVKKWQASTGLGDDIGWAIALPEFEGVIEPVFLGSTAEGSDEIPSREAVPDRCRKIARRVRNWLLLAKKPVAERKVAFILNNNPCASVEGNVGGAAQLDSLESVARILNRMAEAGYSVNPPENGKELIRTILDKKAISEFRWTTVEDIIAKGGALALLGQEEYTRLFSGISPSAMDRVRSTWGDPPGMSMVKDGRIVITGTLWGNAVVCVQPKRGCYGARCDGAVCKILHDPTCPPPYQYLATYRYLTDIFGADVIVHVGTHGNLEFLPGKNVGLSEDCFPDIGIGEVPHLYIYNADNPAEGTTAKRRSYAVLVDHMQTVMTHGDLYDDLAELDRLLGEYETARTDPARAHALSHMIRDALAAAHLDRDIHLTHEIPLEELVAKTHEVLSRIRNTQIQNGLHIFGDLPSGDKRADMIRSIIRFESGEGSIRYIVAGVLGLDITDLLAHQDTVCPKYGISNGALLEKIDGIIKDYVMAVLNNTPCVGRELFGRDLADAERADLDTFADRIRDIDRRIEASDEIGSLLNGFSAGYIPAGPSGIITRGQDDILPTGRNFYSLDPDRVPTKSAWRVGQRLADAMVAKFAKEQNAAPENVAFYWMAGDLMYADGEMLAEMFALMGVEPVWGKNGRVESFTILPLEKLSRPRIDLTIRCSGILRDNFSTRIDLLDDAVCAVAALDEPPDKNYVRKHSIKSMEENASTWRDATLRIFASQPGTYSSGVNLAVLASAWKDEKDLADIFVAFNGYGYGREVPGKSAHPQLASSLSSVSLTFNKVVTDEKDLLGCCCYFGNQGGLTVAARQYSGKEVKAYYGDTREPEHVEVRDLSDEIRRVVRTKLLNPKWIEGMKEHGYKGATDIMKRITRVYGWEASTQEVDDWIFDDIAKTFVNDQEMRQFFEQNNPYALEEISRRLLEAEQRGLWEADEQVLEELKNNYLEIESWMEDQVTEGDFQGGNVDIYSSQDIEAWGGSMEDLLAKVHNRPKSD
ncbi:MAG: cobaltochelatase subunit CobN [Methanoregula sp.]|nr:cobaltochelatase subunit CobN [Methanoregula sp.]